MFTGIVEEIGTVVQLQSDQGGQRAEQEEEEEEEDMLHEKEGGAEPSPKLCPHVRIGATSKIILF